MYRPSPKPLTFPDIFLLILNDMCLPTCMNAFTQGIRLRTKEANTLLNITSQFLPCPHIGSPSILWTSFSMNSPTLCGICIRVLDWKKPLKVILWQEDFPIDIVCGLQPYPSSVPSVNPKLFLDPTSQSLLWHLLRCLGQWFSNLREHQNHPGGLLNHRLLGHTPRISDSAGLGWSGGGAKNLYFFF